MPDVLQRGLIEPSYPPEADEVFLPKPSANGHAAPLKLNLGAGKKEMPDWENIDRKNGREVYPLDYPDNSVDEIRASHILEHFSHRDVPAVLADWVRVLKPGAPLRVAVPNFAWIAEHYLAGDDIPVQGYTMGAHLDKNDRHGCIFDDDELTSHMRNAGLYSIRPWKSELDDCAALPVSLNLQGKKKKSMPKLKIHGAMSVPRLGFQDNFSCWFKALVPFGIYPAAYQGAFWGQCIERVMSEMLDADYILCVDYDSVFTRSHVEHMLLLAADYPEADAIAPLQMRRAGELPLTTIRDPSGRLISEIDLKLFDAELVRVASAHFGMTLIKTSALKKMPHPWFLSVPNEQGKWEDGRQDDDTYFWQKWGQTGNTLFLAPHVVIAHGEFVLKWPRRGDMKPVYQETQDFWKRGMPEGVWR